MIIKMLKRGCIATALLLIPSIAAAQSVGELSSELEGFGPEIEGLASTYLKPALLATRYKLEARYNDGRIAYHLGDYQRAAALLHSVVKSPKFRGFGSYREGVYMLGDALYRVRNNVAAAEQFRAILDEGNGEYFQESAARLLEIAYETRDFDELDALHSRLSGSAMSGKIAYLSGKAFYEQGNHERARESFAKAAQDPEYHMAAEYFRGVSFVAQKKLADAKRIFMALTNATGLQNEKDNEIVELSWLALGRIAYEEGDIERAVDNYNHLERSSRHFDRSLWEQTWVLVSRGNYEEARRNVDILQFLDNPDADIVAQSQLLRADLSLKLGEYDTARADYEAVLDKFGPTQKQMDEFATTHQDMSAFFSALVAAGLEGTEPVPPLIQAWIDSDPGMRAATESLKTMQAAEEAIGDSYRMLDEISSRLNSTTRVQSFPDLADGFVKAVAIEQRLLEIRQELVTLHHSDVQDSMTPEQKAQWSTLVGELDELRKKTGAIPQGREEVGTRQRQVTGEFDRLRRRLDETGFEIENQKAQLRAVDRYLSDDYGRPVSKKERAEVEQVREEIRARLAELAKAQKELAAEVDLNRSGVGEGDPVRVAEDQLKKAYVARLEEAEQFLDALGGASVQQARALIPKVQRQLERFFKDMDEMASEKVGTLSDDVVAERDLADKHRESMQQLLSASQSGAGVLAYVNFMKARTEFTEIVLRGEVGIIDVVWKKKEDRSEKISKLFEDRTSELNLLQEAFEEVR